MAEDWSPQGLNKSPKNGPFTHAVLHAPQCAPHCVGAFGRGGISLSAARLGDHHAMAARRDDDPAELDREGQHIDVSPSADDHVD